MLMPKKVKHRKSQKGRTKGPATRGTELSFGDFGLKAMAHSHITNRQIEAARIAMTRHIKRGGKIWVRIFLIDLPQPSPLKPEWDPAKVHPMVGLLLFVLDAFFSKWKE